MPYNANPDISRIRITVQADEWFETFMKRVGSPGRFLPAVLFFLAILPFTPSVLAAEDRAAFLPAAYGVPLEFILFGLTLLGVAVFHRRNFEIALGGVGLILAYKLLFDGLDGRVHLLHASPLLLNLAGLLLGFSVLAKVFEESRLPEWLPKWLPDDWTGGVVLLAGVAFISVFLDNIAAAMIGGVIGKKVYRGRMTVGFLAAIVAASNAGGAGSVIGDTTTTMMWIAGVPALAVAKAGIASVVAVLFSAVAAARSQQRHQPIKKDSPRTLRIDGLRLWIVGLILSGAIAANLAWGIPALGVWGAIFLGAVFRPIPWAILPNSLKGSLFLLCLVLGASLMPVESLPAASWKTAFALGWVSAGFDNIPLTALAIYQGGFDWGVLAFSVGYGGSMLWFGSSAGVALTNLFPEGKDTLRWIKEGWHIPVAYILGFFAMMAIGGWHP